MNTISIKPVIDNGEDAESFDSLAACLSEGQPTAWGMYLYSESKPSELLADFQTYDEARAAYCSLTGFGLSEVQEARHNLPTAPAGKVPVRFFIETSDDGDIDIVECSAIEFHMAKGVISYVRHTVYANGVSQICLTKSEF